METEAHYMLLAARCIISARQTTVLSLRVAYCDLAVHYEKLALRLAERGDQTGSLVPHPRAEITMGVSTSSNGAQAVPAVNWRKMETFRCFGLAGNGRTVWARHIEAKTVTAAILQAAQIAPTTTAAIEIWLGAEKIYPASVEAAKRVNLHLNFVPSALIAHDFLQSFNEAGRFMLDMVA
jgi:hypothetical protein